MPIKHLLVVCGFSALGVGCAPQNSGAAPTGAKGVAKARQITPKSAPSFSSKAHGFSIWLPVKPIQSQKSSSEKDGPILTATVFQAPTDSVNYAVLVLPTDSKIDVSDPKSHLDVTQKSMMETLSAQSPGANVQKREEIRLDGFAGRELKTSLLQGAANTRVRLYVTPKFFYQIIAGGPKAEVEKQNAQINKVFDSFRILPQ